MRKQKGITLIALVITIIILIILAGVAISLSVGENGLFNKAKEAKEKYTVESIREKVELGIMNLEIEELDLGNEITIESVLQELVEDGTFESIDKDESIGNIGEYEVKLKYNEEQKVVIEYIEKATGVRVTYTLNPVGYTKGDKVSILINVKGTVKSVTKPDNLVVYPKDEIIALDYEVTQNGTYTFIIENEEGNKINKDVIVDTIDRLPPNDFTITLEDIQAGIKVTAETTDAESDGISVKSGMEKYEYFVKGENDTEYTKYETNEIKELGYGEYSVYVTAYDKAGNPKDSTPATITLERPINSRRYVNYEKDLNGDGDTTNDWMIFYEEDGTVNPDYAGATYIIPAYYVPYEKMKTSVEKAGMSLYTGTTYRVYWSSIPSYKTILDGTDTTKPNVKSIFMYDYTGTDNTSAKATSRLLDTSAWESDFVTSKLKAKGGLAIGGPTINMWCASWNKEYPTETITLNIKENGYVLKGYDGTINNQYGTLSISSYTGYKTDAPNIYFPTKNINNDNTYSYWLASPGCYWTDSMLSVDYVAHIGRDNWNSNIRYNNNNVGLRPLVYLPSSIKLEPSGTPNVWNINYGE